MSVQYYVASSLDGFIAAPDNDLAWLMQFGMDEFQAHFDAFMGQVGAIIMGSSTYEFVRAEGPDAWAYGTTPTWVMTTRTQLGIDGADVRFASGDMAAVVEAATSAAGERNVWVVGGGQVAAQIADLGLLDEIHLTLMPVALGSGTPLLPVSVLTRRLQLLRDTRFPGGAVELVYSLRATA